MAYVVSYKMCHSWTRKLVCAHLMAQLTCPAVSTQTGEAVDGVLARASIHARGYHCLLTLVDIHFTSLTYTVIMMSRHFVHHSKIVYYH